MDRERMLFRRNVVGLFLALIICIYTCISERAIASTNVNSTKDAVKYRQVVKWTNYITDVTVRGPEREFYEVSGETEFYIAEGEVFTYVFPSGKDSDGCMVTEGAYLNGVRLLNLKSVSYTVHGENEIYYYTYNDYNKFSIDYVDVNNHTLAKDPVVSKKGKPIRWEINFNRVPGYKVNEIKYWRYPQPLQEVIYTEYLGSYHMRVVMEKIEDVDKIPPDIYAGDIYFPLKAANRGKLSYDYLLEHFSVNDDVDGELTPVEAGSVNGYYMEGYDAALLSNATGDAIMRLKIIAFDKAGNRSELNINCYIIDTKSCHTGDGKKKRLRFANG